MSAKKSKRKAGRQQGKNQTLPNYQGCKWEAIEVAEEAGGDTDGRDHQFEQKEEIVNTKKDRSAN